MSFEFKPNVRLNPFGPTVWHEFTPLADKYSAVNLGQGFPNFTGPSFVVEAAKTAMDQGINQYARSAGHPRLVKALSKLYSPLYSREIDPLNQIVVTVGASEGIFAAMQGLISPGDEVVLMEPFFDIYIGAVTMAGGIPKYVPLKPKAKHITSAADLVIDQEDLEKAITDKTRVLLLNNPQNPTGKAFSYQELEMIANVVKKHPHLVVVSDEVYEWLMFDDVPHIRMQLFLACGRGVSPLAALERLSVALVGRLDGVLDQIKLLPRLHVPISSFLSAWLLLFKRQWQSDSKLL
eukprot:TRINITY_DN575_c0_g1_i1.p1 TRINITY_DN575_c0_g1~~TRINITY_DN575_c0_g1_i1.p1  ORF type:complete len:312 (-),score=57.81 TRINITY_DN575_c0_g1_i1:493-1371(-)